MKKFIAISLLMTGILPAIFAILSPFIYLSSPAEGSEPMTLGAAITIFVLGASIAIFCWLGFRCLWLDKTLREYLGLKSEPTIQKVEPTNNQAVTPKPIPKKVKPQQTMEELREYYQAQELASKSKPKPIINPIFQQKSERNQGKKNAPLKTETLTERRVKALYKLAFDILEDDEVSLDESNKLKKWLLRYPESKDDYRTAELFVTVERALEDRLLDKEEQMELYLLLSDYCDAFEAGKYTKDSPAPAAKKPSTKAKPKSKPKKVSAQSKPKFIDDLSFDEECSMVYENADGEISYRDIYFKSYSVNESGQGYIRAKCLTRNAVRTFRTDRIMSLVSLESGEVLI